MVLRRHPSQDAFALISAVEEDLPWSTCRNASRSWNGALTPSHVNSAGGGGVAYGLTVLGPLTWALPSGTAQDAGRGLAQRVTALEQLLVHFSRDGNTFIITGANLWPGQPVRRLQRTP